MKNFILSLIAGTFLISDQAMAYHRFLCQGPFMAKGDVHGSIKILNPGREDSFEVLEGLTNKVIFLDSKFRDFITIYPWQSLSTKIKNQAGITVTTKTDGESSIKISVSEFGSEKTIMCKIDD